MKGRKDRAGKKVKGKEGAYFWLQHCGQWWPRIYLVCKWRYWATNILGLLIPLLLLCKPSSSQFLVKFQKCCCYGSESGPW